MRTETPTSPSRSRLLVIGMVAGGLALLAAFVVYLIAMHHDQTITTRVARAIGLAAYRTNHGGAFGMEKSDLIVDSDRNAFTVALTRYGFSVIKKNENLYTVIVARTETLPWPERLVYPASTGVNVHFNADGTIADLSEAKEFRR